MAVEPDADDGAVAAAEEAATTVIDLDKVDASADDVAENAYAMRWSPGVMLCDLAADAERQSGGAQDKRDLEQVDALHRSHSNQRRRM
jgi:hypothetical protein